MLLLLGLAWVALPSPIEDFLQKNGFSDVKENFLENEVTLQVVGLLTDDDLTKLGLLTIGRRRLFNLAAASVAQGGGREEENEREVEAGREEGREEDPECRLHPKTPTTSSSHPLLSHAQVVHLLLLLLHLPLLLCRLLLFHLPLLLSQAVVEMRRARWSKATC